MNHKTWAQYLKNRSNVSPACMPNVFGVGAARCGTTTLYHVFKRSDSVYVPGVKELAYFSNHHREEKNGNWFEEDYLSFFVGGESFPYRADITPHYLHSKRAVERIHTASPQAKIIIQLRDPVERAISHYRHHLSAHGFNDINEYFSLGIKAYEDENIKWVSWKHPLNNMRQSFYYEASKLYVDTFGRKSCFFIALNDLSCNQSGVIDNLSSWLEVPLSASEEVRMNMSNNSSSYLNEELKGKLYSIYADDWKKMKSFLNA